MDERITQAHRDVLARADAIAKQGIVEYGGGEYEGLMRVGDKTDVTLDQVRQLAALVVQQHEALVGLVTVLDPAYDFGNCNDLCIDIALDYATRTMAGVPVMPCGCAQQTMKCEAGGPLDCERRLIAVQVLAEAKARRRS